MFPKASATNNWYYNPQLKELAKENRKQSTKAEVKIWREILGGRQMRGYTFLRQRPIKKYIVDFFCKELLLIIEIDGLSHLFKEIYENDLKREKELTDLGLTVIRFDDNLVWNHIEVVSQQLELWIEEYEEKKL